MSRPLFLYRLLLRLLAPLLIIFNLWQARQAGQRRLFWQRLGFSLPSSENAPIWLHAASVGELIAAQPLIFALRKRFPQIPIVVSTVTASAAALAHQRLPNDIQHVYLAMDWPGATKRLLEQLKPRVALIMETELWPNLFRNIACQNIPLLIVNARLSQRSRNAKPWVRALYAQTLSHVSAILARSKDDADAYIKLGAAPQRVELIGNIKYAATPQQTVQAITLTRPYVLAASTHDNEEQQLAQLWHNMAEKTQGRLLVIAPRHPQRRDDILKQLQQPHIAVRSRGDIVNADTRIYLADTLGELEAFIAGADCVFMGGSLIARGGHNILEPARLGKAVVFGAHMDNFSEETQLLLGASAAAQVADAQALQTLLSDWLEKPDKAVQMGENAARLLAQQHAVLENYLQAISQHCDLKK
jgi:3-deoxy-D-manno-octulosonic-acid transferase